MNTISTLLSPSRRRLAAFAAVLVLMFVLPLAVPSALGGAATPAPAPAPAAGAATPTVSSSAAVGMPIPLAGIKLPGLIGRIIKYLIGISGVIALVMFIYGGLSWMLAQGNQEKITAAKNTVVWSVIGLVLIFASYAIATFVINALAPT